MWAVLSFDERTIKIRKLFEFSRDAIEYTDYLRKNERHWEHDFQLIEG
jgi:hypothetical protein